MEKEKGNPDVQALFDDFWEWQMKDSPEDSSLIGFKKYDALLESVSPESYVLREKTCKRYLEKCEKLLQSDVTHEERKNLLVLKHIVVTFIEGFPYKGWLYCISSLEGPHIDYERVIRNWMQLEKESDYRNAISRLKAFPRQAQEYKLLLRMAIKEGRTMHAEGMVRVNEMFSRIVDVKNIEDCPFYSCFAKTNLSAEVEKELQEEAKYVISTKLIPAFKELWQLIKDEYIPALRKECGVCSLPDGKAFYQQLLKYHTETDMTAEEIHELGLKEIQRIEKEMKQAIEEIGSNDSVVEFLEKMRQDPQFYCNSADELLQEFEDTIQNKIAPKIDTIILNVPKTKLKVVGNPDPQGTEITVYYETESYDRNRAGMFAVTSGLYSIIPRYEVLPLSLHEAMPGHHLQTSTLVGMPEIPDFRKFVDSRKYHAAPSRFPYFTAYAEGWGLYSETLGKELGLYKDPYARLGYLSTDNFRACRLVADTGMNAFGWSFDKAVNFVRQHSALNHEYIKNEVRRFVVWPAQGCGYKTGERMFAKMRADCEKALGKKFDIRKFHDVILRNAGVMSIVQEEIEAYIKKESTANL